MTAKEATLPERDPSKSAEAQGMFRKFDVRRLDGSNAPGGKHHGCEYFVLDLDHDQHAPAALVAYANACKVTHPQLSVDLLERYAQERPDILEKLTYHRHERDDMTLDDCLEYLANRWKKIHGRPERALIMQITELLAAAPQQPVAASSEPVALTDEFIQALIDQICNLSGRDSPDDEPDAMTLTGKELDACIRNVEEKFDELDKPIFTGLASPNQPVQAKALTDERAAFEAAYAKLCCVPNTSDEDAMREMVQANRFALVNGMNWRHSRDEIGEYLDSTVQRSWEIWQARALLASQPSAQPIEKVAALKSKIIEYGKQRFRVGAAGKQNDDAIRNMMKSEQTFEEIESDLSDLVASQPSAPADVTAGRDAALEECRILCVAEEEEAGRHGQWMAVTACQVIAKKICALKSAAPTAQPQVEQAGGKV